MATRIEWTQETWNPVTGCTPISEGCNNCYARRMAKRLAGRFGYPKEDSFKITLHPRLLTRPHEWKRPRMVFVCSMGDLFHHDIPFNYIENIFEVMKDCPQHTFQILTKRPANIFEFCASVYHREMFSNLWLGVTAENQATADRRVTLLIHSPAQVHFASCEPLLGPIVFKEIHYLKWVIVGAETGPNKRPMDLDWARSIRDQCLAAGVPFFFKKDSEGNRDLDGKIWDQYPKEQTK